MNTTPTTLPAVPDGLPGGIKRILNDVKALFEFLSAYQEVQGLEQVTAEAQARLAATRATAEQAKIDAAETINASAANAHRQCEEFGLSIAQYRETHDNLLADIEAGKQKLADVQAAIEQAQTRVDGLNAERARILKSLGAEG